MSLGPRSQVSEAVRHPDFHEPPARWYHKAAAMIFIIFCLELGLFLLVFPWSAYWENNLFSSRLPQWHRIWVSSYLRGAISGLGVLNLYISFSEIFRLSRFSKP